MAIITKTTGVIVQNGKTYGQGYIIYTPDKKEDEPSIMKNGSPFKPIKKDWDWINTGAEYREDYWKIGGYWKIIGEAHFFETKGKKIAIEALMPQVMRSGKILSHHSNGYPESIGITEAQLANLLEGKKTFQQVCTACAGQNFSGISCVILQYFFSSIWFLMVLGIIVYVLLWAFNILN